MLMLRRCYMILMPIRRALFATRFRHARLRYDIAARVDCDATLMAPWRYAAAYFSYAALR